MELEKDTRKDFPRLVYGPDNVMNAFGPTQVARANDQFELDALLKQGYRLTPEAPVPEAPKAKPEARKSE